MALVGRTLLPLLVLAPLCRAAAPADETGGRPRQRSIRVQRKEVFEFIEPLRVRKVGRDDYEISFASKDYCDVAVAVEDAKGRMVRHLAAGLLGPNAPGPLVKNSLRQAIRWDGKDDLKRYVDPPERFRVRVSLGLHAAFERIMGDFHPKNNSGHISAVGADPDGVYVLSIGLGSTVRMFDHQGNYVRTVYPFPADKIEGFTDLPHDDYPDGARVPRKDWNQWTDFMGFLIPEGAPPSNRSMVVSNGRIVLTSDGQRSLVYFGTDGGPPGELPLCGPKPFTERTFHPIVPMRLAASPDGKWLYLSDVFVRTLGRKPPPHHLHAVWRIPFAATCDAQKKKVGFIGDGMIPGTDPDQLNTPTGIATDAAGRIYVADSGNNRISVFSPDGKPVTSVPVSRPDWINVHPRTGEIYLISMPERMPARRGPTPYTFELVKLGPLEDPQARIRQPITSRTVGFRPLLAVDFWAPRPVAWVTAGFGVLALYEDSGTRFVRKADFREDLKRAWKDVPVLFGHGKRDPPPLAEGAHPRIRVFHDPAHNKLYSGAGSSFPYLRRFDPETGRFEAFVFLPFVAEDAAFDGSGLLYLRDNVAGPTRQSIGRYHPVAMTEVPFDYGEKLTPRWCRPLRGGINTPTMNFGRFHEPGMAVSKSGQVYVFGKNAQLSDPEMDKIKHGGRPGDGNRLFSWTYKPGDDRYMPKKYAGRFLGISNLVFVYGRNGELLREDAIQGVSHASRGIGTDLAGNIFICTSDTGIVHGKPYGHPFSGNRGVLWKFPATGGRFLAARSRVRLKELPKRPPDAIASYFSGANCNLWVEGAEWYFPGIGTVSHCGCRCMKNRFAVDYFGRIFVPEPDRYSISVLDNSGMVILRFGRYGNADSAGAESRVPIGGDEIAFAHTPHLAVDTDTRLFAADMSNKRIVSIRLSYHAEQTARLPR